VLQIVGIDTLKSMDDAPRMKMVADHLDGLRAHRRLERAMLVIMVENNGQMAPFASRLAQTFSGPRWGPTYHVYDIANKDQKRYGVVTTQHNKTRYVIVTRALLEARKLRFSKSGVAGFDGEEWGHNQTKLLGQLARFQKRVERKSSVFSGYKEYWSGKSSSGDGYDDLAMALLLTLFHMRARMRDPVFCDTMTARYMPVGLGNDLG